MPYDAMRYEFYTQFPLVLLYTIIAFVILVKLHRFGFRRFLRGMCRLTLVLPALLLAVLATLVSRI